MKAKKKVRVLLIALGCLLAVGACGLVAAAGSYISGMNTPLDETQVWGTDQAAAQIEITDAWIEGLLNGELTLDELTVTDIDEAQPASEAQGAAEQPTEEAASTETGSSVTAPTTPENGTAQAGSEAASDAAQEQEESWKQEIKALLQQLYAVKARANSGLDQCVAEAKAEYKALPSSEQTQTKKVSICLSKAGQLRALQSACDKEVNTIVDEMRQVLEQNGQSTELADSALAMYKSEKEATYAALLSKLYS